jgi:hypothetical protein
MNDLNWKSIGTALGILIVGIILILIDVFRDNVQEPYVWISIGCSLIASALVILMTELLVNRVKADPLEGWNLEKIYFTRSEKNADSDPKLEKVKDNLDAVAFGLSSFRSKYGNKMEKILKKGVNVRILTMNPNGNFVNQRDVEEGSVPGNTKQSIDALVIWAKQMNQKSKRGKIQIKGYNCMTLNFYWRMDNIVYVGPYWFGYKSGDTVTYSFRKGGKGFELYSSYFERLWNDANNNLQLL